MTSTRAVVLFSGMFYVGIWVQLTLMQFAYAVAGTGQGWWGDRLVAELEAYPHHLVLDADSSVVDANCRTWDHPNLFICDGSVFVTPGGAQPGQTIMAGPLASPTISSPERPAGWRPPERRP